MSCFHKNVHLSSLHLNNHLELYVYVSGKHQYIVDNRLYDLRRGDIVIIGPRQVHKALPAGEGQYLAEALQKSLIATLNSGSRRSPKQAAGVYLMEHIQCPGILIECGFLSNPQEEAKLRSPEYQKKLCCVIAANVVSFALDRQTND